MIQQVVRSTVEPLETRRLMAVFMVTSTGDNGGLDPAAGAGSGTLRQALVDANASVDTSNTVDFAIAGEAALRIDITASLPAVDVPLVIDGASEGPILGSVENVPSIYISSTDPSFEGLTFSGGNSSVQDIAIGGFQEGIHFGGTLGGNSVSGSYVGLNPDGVTADANNIGIYLETGATLGGAGIAQRNVVANNSTGILIAGSVPSGQAIVQGNYIGLNPSGNASQGNEFGIDSEADGTLIQGNVISGNSNSGIDNNGRNVNIQGNLIGTDSSGMTAVANGVGIVAGGFGTDLLIGGETVNAGNIISGNSGDGIVVLDAEGSFTIEGNSIGVGKDASVAIGNGGDGIDVNSASVINTADITIGGSTPADRNVIVNNVGNGIEIVAVGGQHVVVQGNYVGTADGATPAGNLGDGIKVTGSITPVSIGGLTAGQRNVISANAVNGVEVDQGQTAGTLTSAADVEGNLIGLAVDGSLATGMGNAASGIAFIGATRSAVSGTVYGNTIAQSVDGVYNALAQVTVGGVGPARGNLIENNTDAGILFLMSGNGSILNNTAVGNNFGIAVEAATAQIGGTDAGDGNLISGNQNYGVYVANASAPVAIQGNKIGTNADGTAAMPNFTGINVVQSSDVLIGGTVAGAGNLISGNGSNVTVYESDFAVVQGNVIGGTVTGDTLPGATMAFAGVDLISSTSSQIGGSTPTAGNIISHNEVGVILTGGSGTNNIIRYNTLANNGRNNQGGGIVLQSVTNTDRPSANDVGDADMGVNNLQNSPVLASATVTDGELSVAAYLNSTPSTAFLVDFYAGSTLDSTGSSEGQNHVGTVLVTTDANGNATFSPTFATALTGTQYLTATATTAAGSPYGDTSQFSPSVLAKVVTTRPGGNDNPTLSIGTAKQAEGNSGNSTFAFPVTLSAVSTLNVTVNYTTGDLTATTADGDYVAAAGTITIPAGQLSGVINVTVNGDTKVEADEKFTVMLSAPVGATIVSGTGVGTILNDDTVVTPPTTIAPSISIGNVTQSAVTGGFTAFDFLLSRTGDTSGTSTVQFASLDGSAKVSNGDYNPVAGTIMFGPGVTAQTIEVDVFGDSNLYPTGRFYVDLSNASNATISSAIGIGTIDEPLPVVPVKPTTGGVSGQVTGGPTGGGETVYLDTNNNSLLDAGELSTTTLSGGAYSFTGVPAGAYIVRQVLPNGLSQVSPAKNYGDHVIVTAGATATGQNFVDASTPVITPPGGSVSGSVNGGKAGETVYLDANNNSTLDGGERSTTTNAKGFYSFSNVPVGSYIVRQVVPSGYSQVSPASNYGLHISVAAQQTLTNQNFTDKANATATHAKLSGTVIGTAGSYNNGGNTIANAVDGNVNTYFDAAQSSGAWVGIDLGSAKVATEVRYTPRAGYGGRMKGGMFQASNTADFSSGVVTLATIGGVPSSGVVATLSLNNTAAYRYYRYLSPAGGHANIAELEFDD